MGLNEIRLLEENSLSPIKRQPKQNMQKVFFLIVILAPLNVNGGHHAKSR